MSAPAACDQGALSPAPCPPATVWAEGRTGEARRTPRCRQSSSVTAWGKPCSVPGPGRSTACRWQGQGRGQGKGRQRKEDRAREARQGEEGGWDLLLASLTRALLEPRRAHWKLPESLCPWFPARCWLQGPSEPGKCLLTGQDRPNVGSDPSTPSPA